MNRILRSGPRFFAGVADHVESRWRRSLQNPAVRAPRPTQPLTLSSLPFSPLSTGEGRRVLLGSPWLGSELAGCGFALLRCFLDASFPKTAFLEHHPRR